MKEKQKSDLEKAQDEKQADVKKDDAIPKEGEEKTSEAKNSTTEKTKDNTQAEKKGDESDNKDEHLKGGEVINPIAYAIKLRSIHPHDSYGRCGYRFYKDKESVISAKELTGEQVITLAEDPWLELVPVCEE